MKRQLITGYGANESSRIPLRQLIDGLVGNSLSIAADNRTEVLNEVGRGVILLNYNDRFVQLLDDIIRAVISNSRRGEIHIRAEKKKGNLVLHIEDRSNYNGYALSFSAGALANDAALIGGRLEIVNPNSLETMVLLSVPANFAA